MSQKQIYGIRSLYDPNTASTVQLDLQLDVQIVNALPDEKKRACAAVFIDGLSQLRSERLLENKRKQTSLGQPPH